MERFPNRSKKAVKDRWKKIASEQLRKAHALQVHGERKAWDEEQDEQVRQRSLTVIGVYELTLGAAAWVEATGRHPAGHRLAHGPVCEVGAAEVGQDRGRGREAEAGVVQQGGGQACTFDSL